MDLKHANRAAFLIMLGNINSTTATDREEVTVEAATAPAGTEAAIAFKYRMSGASARTPGAQSPPSPLPRHLNRSCHARQHAGLDRD
jgi:hypothetical protein